MSTFVVFGATGGTGKHFVELAVRAGHKVRALLRDTRKAPAAWRRSDNIQIVEGSITDDKLKMDDLLLGADYIVAMVGDKVAQQQRPIVYPFVRDQLLPAMRKNKVKRLHYQAGGLTKPPDAELPWLFWILRYTIARSFEGQHKDNEKVLELLAQEADDIEWSVHRAGIGSDGQSKGKLESSPTKFSIGTHIDCAEYAYRTVQDGASVHVCTLSHYV